MTFGRNIQNTPVHMHNAKYLSRTTSYHAKPTPCAVCYVPQRSAQLMMPASNTCPVGWTPEYDGYLMSGHPAYESSSYICVDSAPEVATGLLSSIKRFFCSSESAVELCRVPNLPKVWTCRVWCAPNDNSTAVDDYCGWRHALILYVNLF